MLAWEIGYQDVSCRSDCMEAISLIQDSTSQPNKYVETTYSIKELMSRNRVVSLVHIYREDNVQTTWQKYVGGNSLDLLRIFLEPLPCLSYLLLFILVYKYLDHIILVLEI